jgi:hypothetical protein
MDFAETTILGLIAINPGFQKKALLIGLAIFTIAFLLGVLVAFVTITMPLTDIYMNKYNQITQNDTLKCYNVSGMLSPIAVDNSKMSQYCRATYCSNIPIIGQMPDVS